jgi:protein-L-isoaspartate O-methyltransferase
MIAAAAIGRSDHVLEVGAGSGYAAAVMSLLAMQVYTNERRPKLARVAVERLRLLGYSTVEVKTGMRQASLWTSWSLQHIGDYLASQVVDVVEKALAFEL